MKKILLGLVLLTFISAGCELMDLPREAPSSPKESYGELPR